MLVGGRWYWSVEKINAGIDRDGCSLSGVSARCHWEERKVTAKIGSAWRSPETEEEEDDDEDDDDNDDDDDGADSQDDGVDGVNDQVVRTSRANRGNGQPPAAAAAAGAAAAAAAAGVPDEIWPIRRLYKGVHLTLNLEAASLLPVVLRYYHISFSRQLGNEFPVPFYSRVIF